MWTTLAVLGVVVFLARLAKWIVDPYLAWKKNYQTRTQEYHHQLIQTYKNHHSWQLL
jgi:hypothetical protein